MRVIRMSEEEAKAPQLPMREATPEEERRQVEEQVMPAKICSGCR